MRFERLTNEKHEMYKKALELYSISFPSHEQRDIVSQTKILNDDDYYFNLIYDEEAFVGLALCWETKSFVYVEHFCILPEMRNKKYGQKVLQLLRQNGRMVILEIDPPVDVLSIRRKRFYERGGFVENPYFHVHPPYRRENSGHTLVIMSFPKTIPQAEYDAFKYYLEHHVMKDVFS